MQKYIIALKQGTQIRAVFLIDLLWLPFVLCCKLYAYVTCTYVYAFNWLENHNCALTSVE